MKRENKLELQTDTNGCLAGRAAVGLGLENKRSNVVSLASPGTPQARHEQEPSRAAEKKKAALCIPVGNWQGTLSSPPRRKWRSLTLLEERSAGNIF